MAFDMRKACCRGTPAEERFNLCYMPEPNSGCWLWIGAISGSNGYGRISVNRADQRAHRYSYILHKGEIPRGMFVLHRCDTPTCVNPDHLFLGTQQDNESDKVRKGRQARGEKLSAAQREKRPRGTRQGLSKLNPEQVRHIRASSLAQRKLAAFYGVTQAAISSIKTWRTWND